MIKLTAPGRDARLGDHQAQGSQNTVFRRALRSQNFSREAPIADLQRHIGERAADIDAEPYDRRGCHA